MNKQLPFNGYILAFNQLNLEFIHAPRPWYQSTVFTVSFGLITSSSLIISALEKDDNMQLVFCIVLLFGFVTIGISELIDFIKRKKTSSKDEILIADIRNVKFKKTLFNNVSVAIYHGKKGFRLFRCHKKALEESGFIPFLQQLNTSITLP